MYGKFSVGFRVINERATMELEYKDTSLGSMYGPMHNLCHMNTLPGMTQMVTPLAKSTPDNSVFTNACNIRYFATLLGIYWNQLPMSKQDPPIWRGK